LARAWGVAGVGSGRHRLAERRTFGPEVPLWRWKPGFDIAGGDRVTEIRPDSSTSP
jgi:hypothetical protein